MKTLTDYRGDRHGAPAFTLAELLVVIGIFVLLAAARLPALCAAKAPSQLTQCLNNCRQIGVAALLYRGDNNDAYPYGHRVMGWGTGDGGILDPMGWPMSLGRYLGITAGSTNQPKVYLCPSEKGLAAGWGIQLHYQGNRMLLSDVDDRDQPIRGRQMRKTSNIWMIMEKGPSDFVSIRPGGLANPVLIAWNVSPGYQQYRRHGGGMSTAAADGHVEWLRTPPYQPRRQAPTGFLELGDCVNGQNPASSWLDDVRLVKLYCRYAQGSSE
jgi:prepilin-type processing-associated H-X9-DG protein